MPQYRPLPRSFYRRPTLVVARDLLGCLLVRRIGRKCLVVRIVECEAYRQDDPASHAFRGKTPRNEVMFRDGGHLYVYFTYGMHFCSNVVTGREGRGEAVLIRAVEPVEGEELMRKNRPNPGVDMTNGPAKVCQALRLGRAENGTDLCGASIFISRGRRIPSSRVRRSTRIGISAGHEKRWRFTIHENPWLSR
jgi:DNA-3-methyladenine glycosylase